MSCKCDVPGRCPWHNLITTGESLIECENHGRVSTPYTMEPCIYLGKALEDNTFECRLHGVCKLDSRDGTTNARSCNRCKDKNLDSKFDLKKWKDPLRIVTSDGTPTTSLRNFLKGGSAFLVCGGPSLKQLPYQRLAERGVFSLGVNNVAAFAPCSAFVCSDPPSKFHSSIFYDPKIMKFLPEPKLKKNRGKLRKKVGNEFFETGNSTADCPNTWGFERRSWLSPDDTWFTEPSAAWGNHDSGVEKTGEPKTVNTTFLGLRILQYLGAKNIFLLGVDFKMDKARGIVGNYAFGEEKHLNACDSNNEQYKVSNDWLIRLRSVFEKYGSNVYNCNQTSGLRAFDFVPFDVALQVVKGRTESEPYDLERWYEK